MKLVLSTGKDSDPFSLCVDGRLPRDDVNPTLDSWIFTDSTDRTPGGWGDLREGRGDETHGGRVAFPKEIPKNWWFESRRVTGDRTVEWEDGSELTLQRKGFSKGTGRINIFIQLWWRVGGRNKRQIRRGPWKTVKLTVKVWCRRTNERQVGSGE